MSTETETPATLFCPNCGVEQPADIPACPHCGAPVSQNSADADSPRRDVLWQWIDNPWVLLAGLFFVTAGLGIPFLWKSRAFGPVMKVVLTVMVSLYTLFILWLFYLVMAWSFGRIADTWSSF